MSATSAGPARASNGRDAGLEASSSGSKKGANEAMSRPTSVASTSSRASSSRIDGAAASSSSSASEAGTAAHERPERLLPFEQRRVRHITTILLRNLVLPDQTERPPLSSTKLVRPTPRRSASVLSTSSTHTMRRTASNRTLRPRGRRRTSSVLSTRKGQEQDRAEDAENADDTEEADADLGPNAELPQLEEDRLTTYLAWDGASLRDAIHSRMATAFVTLSRISDGVCFYRTPLSTAVGLNHQWGRAPDSTADAEGLDMSTYGQFGSDEQIRLVVWARRSEDHRPYAKGKAVDRGLVYVQPGEEQEQGFGQVLDEVVHLHDMLTVDAKLMPPLPPNAVVIGLTFPLAQLTISEHEAEDASETPSVVATAQELASKSSSGGEQRYYLAVPRSYNRRDAGVAYMSNSELRHKLKTGEMARSYEIDAVLRILQLQGQLFEVSEALSNIARQSNEEVQRDDAPLHQQHREGESRDRLEVLHTLRDTTSSSTSLVRRQMADRREQLRRRKARLDMAKRLMTAERKEYEDLHARLLQMSKLRDKVRSAVFARRVILFRQLEYIYDIDLVDASDLTFRIAGIPLVNLSDVTDAKNKTLPDDDRVSSAFGMIAQMVALMSVYLDCPLHYPIATAGSRSVIQDGISVMSGPRAFPLFSKGVERYRFDYGHFLLNKDIEQLMNVAGLPILDIRNTLPNLKNLIVTLTAMDQPHSKLARQVHVGTELISLIGTSPDQETVAVEEGKATSSQVALAEQLGLGHPSSAPSATEADSRQSSRFGMSLLGWGSATSPRSKTAKTNGTDATDAARSRPADGFPS